MRRHRRRSRRLRLGARLFADGLRRLGLHRLDLRRVGRAGAGGRRGLHRLGLHRRNLLLPRAPRRRHGTGHRRTKAEGAAAALAHLHPVVEIEQNGYGPADADDSGWCHRDTEP